MIVDELYTSIDRGRKGLNKGLSTGLEKLDKVTYGVQRGWLTVIAADSGAGKSTFTNFIAIYNPFKQWLESGKNFSLHFLLFSFEMSAQVIFAKLLSIYVYEKFHYVLSYEKILSLKSQLADEEYDIVCKCQDWLKDLESICLIIDKPLNGDGIYAVTKEWTRKFGAYQEEGNHENYIPNDPQQYLIVVYDHVGLTKNSGNVKSEIDKATTYLIHLRNKCNLTIYLVQQLNRQIKSGQRKETGDLVNLSDLRDSSDTSNAAELVLALYNPFREKISRCEGYDIRQLLDRCRICLCLKHRFGQSDVSIGLNFFGEIGLFRCLPLPDQISDYSLYTKL